MQLNKNIKIFINYFLGPLLFAWLAFSIYQQIIRQPHLESSWEQIRQSFGSYKLIYLASAVLLIPVNWGLEAWKWKASVDTTYPIRFWHAFKAVLSGVSVSVTMPNRVGEYVGRILYLPEGNRLKTISVTIVGSIAQLIITVICGVAGLLVLKNIFLEQLEGFRIWYQFLLYGLIIIAAIILLIYFNVSGTVHLFRKWIKQEKHVYLIEALQNFGPRLLFKLLSISLVRYAVFVIQYILLFRFYDVQVDAGTLVSVVAVVFLAISVIPSIALVEVGLRNEISIKLVGLFSANILGISFTSVTVWFLNLILPAIAGSLLILNLRVFKKKNEHI